MLTKKERDGRYTLSMAEWTGIRVLHAAIGALNHDAPSLQERLQKETDNGWTQLRQAQGALKKVDEKLLATIPLRQREVMYRELQHTYMHVNVEMGAVGKQEGIIYVSKSALERLVDRAIQLDCFACSKVGKETKRCRLFRDIQGVFHYDISPCEDGLCPFAGLTEIPKGDDRYDQDADHSQNAQAEDAIHKGKHAKGSAKGKR